MFTQFFSKTRFLKTAVVILTISFILTSVPVGYANVDALRPRSAQGNAGVIETLGREMRGGSGDAPYATTNDVNVRGKTTLVRVDVNVPAAGGHIINIENPEVRMIAEADTLRQLAEKDARVVVIFHQGRPGEPDFMDTPFEHAKQMEALVGRKIKVVDDLFGKKAIAAIKGLKDGEILFLKPVRAADPSMPGGILEDNPYFVSVLRPLIDYFVLDGFSVAHRDSASVTGFKGMPTLAGTLMACEIETNNSFLKPLKPRFAAVGGGKLSDKFSGFTAELEARADKVLVAGRLANLLLVAMQPEAAQVKTPEEAKALAVKTVGQRTADEFEKEGDLNLLSELVDLLTKHKDKIIPIVDMVYLDEKDARQEVVLSDGRVPEGFNYLLKGIGPKTVQQAVSVIEQGNFKSAHIMGPLTDSRVPALLAENRMLFAAFQEKVPFWTTAGQDTKSVADKITKESQGKIKPSAYTLAGSAAGEFVDKKGKIPGVEFVRDNQPDKLMGRAFVPSTSAEAYTLAHTEVLGDLARTFQEAGSKVGVTTTLFIDGGRANAARFITTPLPTAVRENLLRLFGDEVTNAIAALEAVDVDAINPHINFSISTLYTLDNRPINAARLRQDLARDKNVALILIPGEIDRRGRPGKPGNINNKGLTERLERILLTTLRQHGVDHNIVESALPKPLPAIAQVRNSDIPSRLKLTVITPVPGSRIYNLMQLAQNAGIDLKGLLEKEMPIIIDDKTAKEEARLLELPLLGEAPVLPTPALVKAEVKAQEPSPLAGMSLFGEKINAVLQTFLLDDSSVRYMHWDKELQDVKQTVLNTGKVVRIVVPAGGVAEEEMRTLLMKERANGMTIATHPMFYNGRNSTAFIIRPTVSTLLMGWGNEAIKLALLYQAAGYGVADAETGVPKIAVAIHSLMRSERVAHAFLMGLDVYVTDKTKDRSGNVVVMSPEDLTKFENELKELLVGAFTAEARNEILSKYPESQRQLKADEILRQASELGRKRAEERLAKQYKGGVSKAVMAGEFNLIVDASSDGQGAANKDLLYTKAIAANPGKKIVVVYQGGEAKEVGDASFSTVSAEFEEAADATHLRHVSCNTTGLSSMVFAVEKGIGAPLDVDNLALRRGADPGDLRAVSAGTIVETSYHHWPDALTVLPEEIKPFLRGNTDVAQISTNTSYHFHVLNLRRQDGKRLDAQAVKKILAVMSRVALVEFPGDTFDSTRLTDVATNQLPQVAWAPDGANHLLIPVVTVQETADPSQLRLIYAVPQESIVAPGNINAADALFGHASKDASMGIVNDLSKLSQIVSAVESRLPVKGLEQQPEAVSTAVAPDAAPVVTPGVTPTGVPAPITVPIVPGLAQGFISPEAGVKGVSDVQMNMGISDLSPEISAIMNQRAQVMGVTRKQFDGYIRADQKVYAAIGGNDFDGFVNNVSTSFEAEKPRVLVVSTNLFKSAGVNTALSRVTQLGEAVKIALYGENAEKFKALLGNDVITAGTSEELLSKLRESGFAAADILVLDSVQNDVFAQAEVRQVIAKEASPLAIAKAVKELINTDAADTAFNEFYAKAEESGAVSKDASSESRQAMLAKLERGVFELPDDIRPTQEVSEKIAADALTTSAFIDQI